MDDDDALCYQAFGTVMSIANAPAAIIPPGTSILEWIPYVAGGLGGVIVIAMIVVIIIIAVRTR